MSVRIRLKKMGRKHRPFFRLCAVDIRCPRDGRVLEELGYYDPMVPETDARAILNGERINYWISVGAKPSDKAAVLIKKYGANGTNLDAQKAALERLTQSRTSKASVYVAPAKAEKAEKVEEKAPEAAAEAAPEAAAPEAAE